MYTQKFIAVFIFVLSTVLPFKSALCNAGLASGPSQSFYSSQDEDNQSALDVRRYLETVEVLKNAPLEERINRWEQFLEDYPETAFKEDIKKEIADTRSILRAREKEELSKEAEDRRRYSQFKEEISTLPFDQKVARYEEFIKNNADTGIHDTAVDDLAELKRTASIPAATTPAVSTPSVAAPSDSLTSDLKLKDPEHALFLAAVPGLVVPGMGTFYAGDTTIGVVLVLLRISGLGMMAAGIVRESNGLLITGGIAGGFSWVIDMISAPLIVRENNAKIEKRASSSLTPILSLYDKKPYVGLSYTF
jgi:hypothetical protein